MTETAVVTDGTGQASVTGAVRTHVILDGLQDPLDGQALSVLWTQAGFRNAVDVAGQAAWLEPAGDVAGAAMTTFQADRVVAIGRRYGLQIRDRTGNTFHPDNNLGALRQRIVHEYKSRFATALVFGLPAWALHHAGPILAGGVDPSRGTRPMLYPWLIELLLVGWVCLAAGWPILWQGVLSLVHLRATTDLLTGLIVAVAFVPSAVGVFSMVVVESPWFASSGPGAGPAFHAAFVAVTLAVLQRWLSHRAAQRLRGRADLMLRRVGRLVCVWLVVWVSVSFLFGWRWGLTYGLLMPPSISLGAINALSPGWSIVLPVFAFAGLIVIGPDATGLSLEGMQIETAFGFGLIMTAAFAWGWRQMGESASPSSR